jgi:pyruvate dehydrogenase E1 component alpha subunit
MSDHNGPGSKIDRRTFLKTLGVTGASAVFMSMPKVPQLGNVAAIRPIAGTSAVAPEAAADELAGLPKETLLERYGIMVRSRKWETSVKDIRLGGEPMYGSWYPYVGQEAVANGVALALNQDDWVTMTHRAQGALVAKGGDLKKIAAEIWFRTTGSNGGYGGTMHVIQKDKGILGANGIVGGGWYMAAGAAYASLVKGTKQVAVAFAGDGASNSAYFFSAVRNATLYKVPALFVIENNLYASSTPISRTAPVKDLADYAKGLGLPCIVVDGNDLASVYAVAKAAAERGRAGEGPTVIEAKTYRWYDHYNFAGTKAGVDGAWGLPYRSDDELRQWMARDPIKLYAQFLIERKFATEADLAKLDAQEQANVDEAIAFAKASPHPAPEAGLSNVYAKEAVLATQWFNCKGPAV